MDLLLGDVSYNCDRWHIWQSLDRTFELRILQTVLIGKADRICARKPRSQRNTERQMFISICAGSFFRMNDGGVLRLDLQKPDWQGLLISTDIVATDPASAAIVPSDSDSILDGVQAYSG